MSVVDASYNNKLKVEEHASNPFAGGIANQGYQCGMLWGGALAAGARAHQLYGAGQKAESKAIIATQNLIEKFKTRTKNNINCMEIAALDITNPKGIFKFLIKGGPIRCFSLASKYSKDVYADLNETYAEEHETPVKEAVSCASLLAKKMGLSDMHQTLIAGFAGGIGLTGGACGAYGAAIWAEGVKNPNLEEIGFDPMSSWVGEVTEKFLKSSDYVFECEEIVGRKFKGIEDHAEYICSGGCSKIIEALVLN